VERICLGREYPKDKEEKRLRKRGLRGGGVKTMSVDGKKKINKPWGGTKGRGENRWPNQNPTNFGGPKMQLPSKSEVGNNDG